jgi:hypothetical protein
MNERRRQYGADLLERSRERALGRQHRPTIAVDTFAERSLAETPAAAWTSSLTVRVDAFVDPDRDALRRRVRGPEDQNAVSVAVKDRVGP